MADLIQAFLADINGDGTPDLVIVDSDHRWTALDGRTGNVIDHPGFPPGHQVPGFPCWGRYFFADFTGNRIHDRAYLSPEGKWFVVNGANGGPGVPGVPWGDQPPGWPGLGRYAVADFDGDGIAERCYLSPQGGWFVIDHNGGPGIQGIPWGQTLPGWPGDGHYLLNDFNGDGAVDRIFISTDDRWYYVPTRTGTPGTTSIPWGNQIPGWPGGGRFIAMDFNGDGVADRAYVHPEGRLYIVDSTTGAPMSSTVPGVSAPWGGQLSDVAKLMVDIIVFQAATVGCTIGVASSPTGAGAVLAWASCIQVLGQVNTIIDRIQGMVERNRSREKQVIRQHDRHSTVDLDRDRYYRAYPPETSSSSGGADAHISMSIHAHGNAKDTGVRDCPSSSGAREAPDRYCREDRPRGRDFERFEARPPERFPNPLFILGDDCNEGKK